MNEFNYFMDRVKSLVVRWEGFVRKNPDKELESIKGFLSEVTDQTSDLLVKNLEVKKIENVKITSYPEYVIKAIRQRRDLEEDDTSEDKTINLYSPNEALSEILDWEGIIGYQHKIKSWIKDIYGLDLHAVSNGENKTKIDFVEGARICRKCNNCNIEEGHQYCFNCGSEIDYSK